MIAQDEGNKHVLLALGRRLPKKWAAAEAREEAPAADGVDFNAESVLEESEDCDEVRRSIATQTTRASPTHAHCTHMLAEIAFEEELAMARYAEFEEARPTGASAHLQTDDDLQGSDRRDRGVQGQTDAGDL